MRFFSVILRRYNWETKEEREFTCNDILSATKTGELRFHGLRHNHKTTRTPQTCRT